MLILNRIKGRNFYLKFKGGSAGLSSPNGISTLGGKKTLPSNFPEGVLWPDSSETFALFYYMPGARTS